MTDFSVAKSEKQAAKYAMRQDNFYSQSIADNNARLESKIQSGAVLDELKFIESQLLAKGPEEGVL